jgi:hypothetical protein
MEKPLRAAVTCRQPALIFSENVAVIKKVPAAALKAAAWLLSCLTRVENRRGQYLHLAMSHIDAGQESD